MGSALVRVALAAARRMAIDLGCVGILVDAKAGAVPFYKRLGFERVTLLAGELGDRPAPDTLFLELGAIPG